jgi:hypothetical protein
VVLGGAALDGNYELGHVRFRLHLDRVRCAFRVGEGGAAGPDAHERDYAYIRFLFSHMTEQLFWHVVMPP